MEGFGEYLKDVHEENLMMEAFHGTHAYEEAREAVMRQIDSDSPIPISDAETPEQERTSGGLHMALVYPCRL